MRLPPDRHVDLLALIRDEEPLDSLLRELGTLGFGIDRAADPSTARLAFFQCGGHEVLVLAPDVAPGVGRSVLATLRYMDPDLPVIVYGKPLPREQQLPGVTFLNLHPSSRAGKGAFLRVLRDLPER